MFVPSWFFGDRWRPSRTSAISSSCTVSGIRRKAATRTAGARRPSRRSETAMASVAASSRENCSSSLATIRCCSANGGIATSSRFSPPSPSRGRPTPLIAEAACARTGGELSIHMRKAESMPSNVRTRIQSALTIAGPSRGGEARPGRGFTEGGREYVAGTNRMLDQPLVIFLRDVRLLVAEHALADVLEPHDARTGIGVMRGLQI